jgi:hypothetical protein
MEEKAYLLVHYKSPDTRMDEQVHFALSRDGYAWEAVNGGDPVFVSDKGERGVRDIAILRTKDNKFVILGTDLCMSENFQKKYQKQWANMGRYGSKNISMWKSDDLVHWSEQQLVQLGDDNFGCFWGPDAMYDPTSGKYMVYWASSHSSNDYGAKSIYYAETENFEIFGKAKFLCAKDDASVVDPHIRVLDGTYYRFLKSRSNPFAVILEKGKSFNGAYERVEDFDEWMSRLTANEYEAPLVYQLSDGKWCLLLDYFGENRSCKGYVPFIATDFEKGIFEEASEKFSFPFGMRHGNAIEISLVEYNRIREYWK